MQTKSKQPDLIVGNPLNADKTRVFVDGSSRSYITLNSAIIGMGTYNAGWKWSLHAGSQTGKPAQNHIGYILSGHMVVRDSKGLEQEICPGQAFEVGPGHDAWVIGSEPCVALDFTHTD